jgi:hypothetical protein
MKQSALVLAVLAVFSINAQATSLFPATEITNNTPVSNSTSIAGAQAGAVAGAVSGSYSQGGSSSVKSSIDNANVQGQIQGMAQKQGQSTDNANNSSNSVNVESARNAVSTAYAPSIAPTANCALAVSGGVSVIGFSGSFGKAYIDENCAALEQQKPCYARINHMLRLVRVLVVLVQLNRNSDIINRQSQECGQGREAKHSIR